MLRKVYQRLPMEILSDHQWFESQLGRDMHKSFAVHSHINHPNEEIAYVCDMNDSE